MSQVARTIVNQIRATDRSAYLRWGAKEKVAGSDYVRFKSSGLVKRKCYVTVEYDEGRDLYNVEFGRVRKMEYKVDKAYNGVYCEQLVNVIDSWVG